MDSAGAPTAVVTPPGETPTSPGATEVEGAAALVDDDVVPVGDGVAGGSSVLEEHPATIAARATREANTRGQRILPM